MASVISSIGSIIPSHLALEFFVSGPAVVISYFASSHTFHFSIMIWGCLLQLLPWSQQLLAAKHLPSLSPLL